MSEVQTADVSHGVVSPSSSDPRTQELERHLEKARSLIQDETHAFFEALYREFWEPYGAKWAEAAQKHEEAVLKFTDILDPESPLTWQQTVDYRRVVHLQIFLKLPGKLTPSPYSQIENHFRKYINRLRAVTSKCPEVLEVPINPTLFSSHPSDTLPISLRKWIRRRRQGLRLLGHGSRNVFRRITFRKPLELSKKTQLIPLRHLIEYHISTRLPEQLAPFLHTLHSAITTHLAPFEKAQTEWLHILLESEHRLYTANNVFDTDDLWQPDSKTKLPKGIHGRSVGLAVRKLEDTLPFKVELWESELAKSKERIEAAFDSLQYDTRRGGTILLNLHDRPVSDFNARSSIDEAWRQWHEQVFQRIQLCNEILKFHDRMLSINQNQIKNIYALSIAPILDSYTTLHQQIEVTQEKAGDFCAQAREDGDLEALEKAVNTLSQELVNQFRLILENVNALVRSGEALEQTGNTSWLELNYYVDQLAPVYHVHSPLAVPPQVRHIPSSRYAIRAQELVHKSLKVTTRTDSLQTTALALKKAVFKTWGDTQEVQNIIEFNLAAAIDELNGTAEASEPEIDKEDKSEEESAQNALSNAEKLIDEALSRSREKLNELQSHLELPWSTFIAECFKVTNGNWKTIQEDLRFEDQIHTWLENARILTVRSSTNAILAVSAFSLLVWKRTNSLAKKTKTTYQRLLRKGQSAVGVVEQSEEEWLQTLKRVSNLSSLHESLPLIYQKLFSPNPLNEQDLLEGRQKDLDFIISHFEKWIRGQVGPLVLSMVEGSGRTSLMNVLHLSVFRKAHVHRITLDKRIKTLEVWADLVACALGIKEKGGPAMPLDALESVLIDRKKSTTPDVVLIDQFEHLLLCTPGGDEILERILIFMSRTDHAICWVANVNKDAWHFLEKTIHPSFGFITAYSARLIGRNGLEEILLKRHNRSGLALQFEPEIEGTSPMRFFRPRDEKSKQRYLQRVFFNKLHALSGENIRLAILLWLRAVRFDKENDLMRVRAIKPINFAFLNTLDQIRAFTLKSFMVHGTLTLQEHMDLFKKDRTESTFILESLLNLSIIEPVGQKGSAQQQIHIMDNVPYKLHSLIRYPVTDYLSREHIIY